MGLLDRFFRKAEQAKPEGTPVSRLDEFLMQIKQNDIPAHAARSKEPTLRLPTVISLLVLEQTGRFTRDLFAALRKSPVPVSKTALGGPNFDAAAFEVAGFIGYSLMAKELAATDDWSSDGDEDEIDDDDQDDENAESENPYFIAVRDAHMLTGRFVAQHVSFTLNDKIFDNRPAVYSMATLRRRATVEVFEGMLIEAIEHGAPANLKPNGISLNLGIATTVAISARALDSTTIPAFVDVAKNIVANAAKLGLK